MIPTLTTERLILRAPETRDHSAYAAFYASPRSEILGGPFDDRRAWDVLCAEYAYWPLLGLGVWVIDADGQGIGNCGYRQPPGQADAELGWTLFSGTGRGYATEAARAALDWAARTDTPDFPRIVSYIDRDNASSQRVAARLGARDTGEAPAHDPACTVWEHAA